MDQFFPPLVKREELTHALELFNRKILMTSFGKVMK